MARRRPLDPLSGITLQMMLERLVAHMGWEAMGNEIHLYKLNTKEELLSMVTETYGTESKVDDGKKVFFAVQNTTIQSKTFRGKDWDAMISLLLEEKVINLNGEINPDNLKRFKSKYDDGNVNHTNRN